MREKEKREGGDEEQQREEEKKKKGKEGIKGEMDREREKGSLVV